MTDFAKEARSCMTVIYELTIRVAAMRPASARKLLNEIGEQAETLFEDFAMHGKNIGPMSMDVRGPTKAEG